MVRARLDKILITALAIAIATCLAVSALDVHGATPTDRVRFYFNVTTGGSAGNVIEIDLYGNESPLHVANFLEYVDDGEYDTSFIHRTRAFNPSQPFSHDLFAQGGSFKYPINNSLASNPIIPRDPIPNEFDLANGLSNEPGSLSAARTSDPDSATSGWFINQSDNSGSFDSGPYTVFGQVTRGMALVDAIPFLQNAPNLEGTAFESTPFVNGDLVVIELAVRTGLTEGDYDLDGAVSAADYVVWRNSVGNRVGITRSLEADGNADGTIDDADYEVWLANYGAAGGTSASRALAIPEPRSMLLAAVCVVLASCMRTTAGIFALAGHRRCAILHRNNKV